MSTRKIKYVLLLFIIVTSCDLFVTRDPEAPDKSRTNNNLAITPDILIENLRKSLLDKNPENYIQCFVDVNFLNRIYNFQPTANAAIKYPKLTNWNLDDEKKYFNEFIKSNSKKKISITFSNIEKNYNTNFWTYKIDYLIEIVDNNTKTSIIYNGTSQLELFIDSRNQWSIVEWKDFQFENKPSWSDLKGVYY